MYSYVEGKMKTLRLGLKSYRTFDQAKKLADKVGVVLNESMMNESSSLALSIYSPDNLASLLEDKEVLNKRTENFDCKKTNATKCKLTVDRVSYI